MLPQLISKTAECKEHICSASLTFPWSVFLFLLLVMTHIARPSAHGFLLVTVSISQECWYYVDLVGRAEGPGLPTQCLL